MRNSVEVERPLKHRPNLVVVREGGRIKVLGDRQGLTPNEYALVHGGFQEPQKTVTFTEAEQTELDAAKAQLERVLRAKEKLWNKSAAFGEDYEQAMRQGKELMGIKKQIESVEEMLTRANDLEREARVAQTETQGRIVREARLRCDPPQFANLEKTMAAKLEDLK